MDFEYDQYLSYLLSELYEGNRLLQRYELRRVALALHRLELNHYQQCRERGMTWLRP